MGRAIARERFDARDFRSFAERLQQCLEALAALQARPGFGAGPASIGAELELSLVDPRGRPLPANQKVLAEVMDPRVTYELNRNNLECNLCPVPLAGTPFGALGEELTRLLERVGRAARVCGGDVVAIGILPTLEASHLQAAAMSDVARFRALSAGLRRQAQGPFRVDIDGSEPLQATCDDITFEGANTSFQIHFKADPGRFAALYNAAQWASAPALAAAGNSPTFLGHQLWEETRVALFEQALDTRAGDAAQPGRVTFGNGWVRQGALELFTDTVAQYPPLLPLLSGEDPLACLRGGGTPRLDELRLHNGTVWRWNRPVYDPAEGGHVRIEMRALPAGPTVADMLANAAFLVGLSWDLAQQPLPDRPEAFAAARANFYASARHGLASRLRWLPDASRVGPEPARDLVRRLLRPARRGLRSLGVAAADAEPLLAIIEARVVSGRTGSAWQRAALHTLEHRYGRRRALAGMLEAYRENAARGSPVHTWPSP